MPTPLELAEDFTLYLPPRRDYLRDVTDEYVLTTGVGYATVTRIRLGEIDVERALGDVRARLAGHGVETVMWWCGAGTTPAGLPDRLLALGLRPDDEPVLSVMVLDEAPGGEPTAEVRRVTTFDEFATAMEVALSCSDRPAAQNAERRARLPQLWEVAQEQGAVHYLAYLDGQPVSQARAFFLDGAALLLGADTLPHARGRGAYLALVHARWHDAVQRGAPRLVVQAGRMSRPILERVGFRQIGEIRLVVDELATS